MREYGYAWGDFGYSGEVNKVCGRAVDAAEAALIAAIEAEIQEATKNVTWDRETLRDWVKELLAAQ